MEELISPLKEVIHMGNDLISTVSHHPGVIQQNELTKKGSSKQSEAMDVDHGSLLDQIDGAIKFVAEIDDTIKRIFKSVRNSYSNRFPELKVADPMQYIMTVQILANTPENITDETIKNQLNEFLEPKMQLLVSMTAATTQGTALIDDEMDRILQACAVATHLNRLRSKLLTFVELNMAIIAPNLSVIVGAPIAAQLMGLAGGLTQLANMPSCNLPVLGAHKMSRIETSTSAPTRIGLIYDCDLIQQIPFDHTKDVRKRAVRWVANKCILAARCDMNKSDLSGEAGRTFRDKIASLISKELEPPPKKAARPLPAPIEKSGKRRAGKRVRRMRERYAQTELRKAANRMNFGDVGDDAYQNDLGFGGTQLNALQKLRGPQINEKTAIRLSKGAQKKLAQARKTVEQGSNGTDEVGIVLKPQVHLCDTEISGEPSNDYFSNATGFINIKTKDKQANSTDHAGE